jgi:hypothetical protein
MIRSRFTSEITLLIKSINGFSICNSFLLVSLAKEAYNRRVVMGASFTTIGARKRCCNNEYHFIRMYAG